MTVRPTNRNGFQTKHVNDTQQLKQQSTGSRRRTVKRQKTGRPKRATTTHYTNPGEERGVSTTTTQRTSERTVLMNAGRLGTNDSRVTLQIAATTTTDANVTQQYRPALGGTAPSNRTSPNKQSETEKRTTDRKQWNRTKSRNTTKVDRT